MPPVDRNNPQRAASSESSYSLMEFMREFPDDAACLDFLWRKRFAPDGHTADCPKCKRSRRFHRVKSRPSYSCDSCGHHIHPTAGTIFHRSPTSLQLWFYAMYLMTSTRCAVSAKHLERELGVTYKVAWRMANRIRNYLMTQDDDEPLSGDVEADESYFGGRRRGTRRGRPGPESHKVPVFAMIERKGRVKAVTVENARRVTLLPIVLEKVLPASTVYTDELSSYDTLRRFGYRHERIPHAEAIYVSGNVHTNTVEGFFGNVKNGIRGNYHSVSRKWLQGYLNEFVWRYNHRHDRRPMFQTLLVRAATA
jgi:transposase-like protein